VSVHNREKKPAAAQTTPHTKTLFVLFLFSQGAHAPSAKDKMPDWDQVKEAIENFDVDKKEHEDLLFQMLDLFAKPVISDSVWKEQFEEPRGAMNLWKSMTSSDIAFICHTVDMNRDEWNAALAEGKKGSKTKTKNHVERISDYRRWWRTIATKLTPKDNPNVKEKIAKDYMSHRKERMSRKVGKPAGKAAGGSVSHIDLTLDEEVFSDFFSGNVIGV
jgi:hypothetical protein